MSIREEISGGVRLDATELTAMMRAQTTLLSPFAHSTPSAWCRAVNAAVRAMIGADRAAFYMPHVPGVSSAAPVSDEFAAEALNAFPRQMESVVLTQPFFARACMLGAASRDQMLATDRSAYYGSSYYHDYIVPVRALDCVMLTTTAVSTEIVNRVLRGALPASAMLSGDEDERSAPDVPSLANSAQLLLYHDRVNGPRFGDHEIALIALLYPAFVAGVDAWWRARRTISATKLAIDLLGGALVVFGAANQVAHRSRGYERLASLDSTPNMLHAAVAKVAREFRASGGPSRLRRKAGDDTFAPTRPYLRLATPSHHYQLRVVSLEGVLDSGSDDEQLVGVMVNRMTAADPRPSEVGAHLGLTPAQSTVALAVAEGHSNQEIAQRLRVSVHTVRHHIEHACGRIGVTNRGALAARVRSVPTDEASGY